MKILWMGLFFLSLQVSAGQIYQCGDTFQDRPCAVGQPAKVIGSYEQEKISGDDIKARQEEQAKLEAQTEADSQARYDAEVAAAQRAQDASAIDMGKSDAIKQHRVIEGLTKKEVIKSWGDPDRKKQVTTKYGMREEWTFVKDWGNKDYVYFDGDTVSEVSLTQTTIE